MTAAADRARVDLTIEEPYLAMWIVSAVEALATADYAQQLHRRCKIGSRERDPRWDVYWTCYMAAKREVEMLRDRGGLLHLGSEKAIARACELEQERKRIETARYRATISST